ncbi:GtrA family protein [Microbulbifer sp. MCCC 1A16149]|uniref:GtrA family protein n=1 Tax=Microbulbifer sp. MCCC 1A16149 TaxID=3411322 RepID=UPI003D152AE6
MMRPSEDSPHAPVSGAQKPAWPLAAARLISRAGRFALVGGFATALQYGLLVAMVEVLDVFAVLASALSFCCSALANYLLNYYLTFQGGVQHRRALPRFVLVAALGLTINTLCFSLALAVAPYLLAQVVATLVTLVVNFVLHHFWIYREPEWNP